MTSKFLFYIFLCLAVVACDEDEGELSLRKGFELVSKDRNSYFVLVPQKYQGQRSLQRQKGQKICKYFGQDDGYCEVLFFSNKEDIPKKFPILERKSPMGKYKVAYGDIGIKYLPTPDYEESEKDLFSSIKDFYYEYLKRQKKDSSTFSINCFNRSALFCFEIFSSTICKVNK
jgi:hypothetical protein